jgi:nitrite reductase (NO-forming)
MRFLVLATFAAVTIFGLACHRAGLEPRAQASQKEVKLVDPAQLPTETAKLLPPPQVPPPITRKSPARVKIDLETKEVTKKLADGVDYTFWTVG